ncbi:putative c2h2 domain containing protein [Diplodia seriata]|uniref:Putative c2h2 domain containing protein n=1 Tax=Diplodia seriata TaxID=420778 RepID=A0A0G2EYM8_9PEZI|nr:putative c2h2 domain containing protein [Diplodia seriata]
MATAPLPLTPRFQQRLQEFKRDLSPDQEEHFKFTTLDDLKRLVHSIQEEQTKSRRLTNLRRLAPFLEAMEQFDKVVQVFLNAADLLACIWGPMKFLLLATQTYHDAFNALLDAYVDIGESIPLLAQYEQVFQDKSQMHVVLEFVYTDVLEFHSSAIKYFKSPGERGTLPETR